MEALQPGNKWVVFTDSKFLEMSVAAALLTSMGKTTDHAIETHKKLGYFAFEAESIDSKHAHGLLVMFNNPQPWRIFVPWRDVLCLFQVPGHVIEIAN